MNESRTEYLVEQRYGDKWHPHGYPQDDADAAFRVLSGMMGSTNDIRVRKVTTVTLFERLSGEGSNP
jgi:hypothetical protein